MALKNSSNTNRVNVVIYRIKYGNIIDHRKHYFLSWFLKIKKIISIFAKKMSCFGDRNVASDRINQLKGVGKT